MRRRKLIALLMIFVFVSFVYGQGENTPSPAETEFRSDMSKQDQREWISKNLGINIVGDSFDYKPNTNTLTISQGSAIIPDTFKGNIEVNGGSIILSNDRMFRGYGSYAQGKGFTRIIDGYFESFDNLHIVDGTEVTYEGNTIHGKAGKNSEVNNVKFGEGSEFLFTKEGIELKVKVTGQEGKTTLPNANIRKEGFDYYLEGMKLDAKNSEIYLAKGNKMVLGGLVLEAKGTGVRLFFEDTGINYAIIPKKPGNQKTVVKIYPDKEKYDGDYVPIIPVTLIEKAKNFAENNIDGINKNLNQKITDTYGKKSTIKDAIVKEAEERNIDPALALALISTESSGRTNAYNPKGRPSYGLGQMTEIAVDELKRVNPEGNWNWDDIKDKDKPAENIRASLAYLEYLLKKFPNNEDAAIAAYKAGPSTTARILSKTRSIPKGTQLYVSTVKEFRNKH